MKRIITLVVIMLAMVSVAQSQKYYNYTKVSYGYRTYVPRAYYPSSYYSYYTGFHNPYDWNYCDTILRDISYRKEIEFGNYIFYRYDWQTSKSTVYFKAKINRKDKVNFMANIESYKDTLKNKYYDIKNIEVVTKKNKSNVNLVITYISSEEKAIIKNNIRRNWEAKQRQSWKEKYQEKQKNELTIVEKNNQNLKQENKVKIDSVAMGQKTSKQIDSLFYNYEYGKKVYGYYSYNRVIFYIGNYRFSEDPSTLHFGNDRYGKRKYACIVDVDEKDALFKHLTEHKDYYKEKYNFKEMQISQGYDSSYKVYITASFNDWEEAWEKAQAEKVKAKQEAKQKRIESISW